jgi:hypothetical protein
VGVGNTRRNEKRGDARGLEKRNGPSERPRRKGKKDVLDVEAPFSAAPYSPFLSPLFVWFCLQAVDRRQRDSAASATAVGQVGRAAGLGRGTWDPALGGDPAWPPARPGPTPPSLCPAVPSAAIRPPTRPAVVRASCGEGEHLGLAPRHPREPTVCHLAQDVVGTRARVWVTRSVEE